MKMKVRMLFGVILLLSLLGAAVVFATPNAPTQVDVTSSERRSQTTSTGLSVPAQAGNVTQLLIQDNRTTTHWQGYYGTVNGEITLDDAGNQTIFSWIDVNPTGEVYASNTSTVTWANITCVNLTANISDSGTRSKLNTSILEDFFNITYTDSDGVNETFNYTYSSSFSVGSTTIDNTYNCPLAYMYVNNASQESNFQEVMLTDNVSSIWTALLENNQAGFDGTSLDFEMIVPENSGGGTTDFYFFVELS
jgi:hypothetical protein